jgi:succinyl-CoA synthetase beta subunit
VAGLKKGEPGMKIHEYQAKGVFSRFGVVIPRGIVVSKPEEAEAIAQQMGKPVVIKAQIHAGGRGKGGGVKLVRDLDTVKDVAGSILGMTLVTHQTGAEGRLVKRVLVEEACNIARELYLGMVIDRSRELPVMMACEEGGVEIEEVAARNPEKILKEWVDPGYGLMPYQARRLAFGLGLEKPLISKAVRFMMCLARAFLESDASLAEINPLVITGEGEILALDAKMNIDDNALYRRKELAELRDLNEEDPKEWEAKKFGLSYISLDGNIGCLVNGAGLAMSTMDIIKHCGGEPANFLDVGGGASLEAVTKAFEIILLDEKVRAILVNIFGGIMKCDVIAEGVIEAVKKIGLKVPLVVRLEGTNVERGKQLLSESGLNIVTGDDMADGAKKVVELATSAS